MGSAAEFLPRMQSSTRALRTLAPLAYRRLPGAVADVWTVHGEAGGGGHYVAPDPRIVIFLDDTLDFNEDACPALLLLDRDF